MIAAGATSTARKHGKGKKDKGKGGRKKSKGAAAGKRGAGPGPKKRARILKDLEHRFGSVAPASSPGGVVLKPQRGSVHLRAHVASAPGSATPTGTVGTPHGAHAATATRGGRGVPPGGAAASGLVVGSGDLYDHVRVSAIIGQHVLPSSAAMEAEARDGRAQAVRDFTEAVLGATGKLNVRCRTMCAALRMVAPCGVRTRGS